MQPISSGKTRLIFLVLYIALLFGANRFAFNSWIPVADETSLWFGGIDDIWSFGKPIGEGGPWKNTKVKANTLSDMYLMTGYDKKTLTLRSDKDTTITIFINVNHYLDEPIEFKTFDLNANETVEYKFPDGFSAHWVQVKASDNCIATAWFVYN